MHRSAEKGFSPESGTNATPSQASPASASASPRAFSRDPSNTLRLCSCAFLCASVSGVAEGSAYSASRAQRLLVVGKGDSPLHTRQIAGSLTASIACHRQSKIWPRCPEVPSRAPVVSEIQQVRSRVAALGRVKLILAGWPPVDQGGSPHAEPQSHRRCELHLVPPRGSARMRPSRGT